MLDISFMLLYVDCTIIILVFDHFGFSSTVMIFAHFGFCNRINLDAAFEMQLSFHVWGSWIRVSPFVSTVFIKLANSQKKTKLKWFTYKTNTINIYHTLVIQTIPHLNTCKELIRCAIITRLCFSYAKACSKNYNGWILNFPKLLPYFYLILAKLILAQKLKSLTTVKNHLS